MSYLSSEKIAKKWGISSRRVILLAKEGRIPGVMQIGSRWMIPDNAGKPVDGRTKAGKIRQEEKDFRLPLFINYSENDYLPPLSEEEILLRKAQTEFNACNFDDAKKLLLPLAKSAANPYIRISAVLHLCLVLTATGSVEEFTEFYRISNLLLSADLLYKNEIMLLKYLFEAIIGIPKSLLEDFSIEPDYTYHPSALGLLNAISIFTSPDGDISSISKIRLDPFEALCQQLEYEGKYFEEQLLHLQLAFGYQMKADLGKSIQHMRKILRLAEDRNLIYLAAINTSYLPELFKAVASEFPEDFIRNIRHYAGISHEGYITLTKSLGKSTFYSSLSAKEYRFVYLASQGYSNKEIAKILDTTEFYISKQFSIIYRKLNIKGKTELRKLFTSAVF